MYDPFAELQMSILVPNIAYEPFFHPSSFFLMSPEGVGVRGLLPHLNMYWWISPKRLAWCLHQRSFTSERIFFDSAQSLVYYSLPSSKQIISGQACDLSLSVWIVPLPAFSLTEIFSKIYSGTTKIKNLDANIDSLKVKLTDDDLKEISSEIREEDVAGARQNTSFRPTNWNYADTPRK